MKHTNKSNENNVSSVDQLKFMLYATKDKRLSACDLAVLFELTDRYVKRDGTAYPTGAAHLERETGRGVDAVKASRTKLVKFHYVRVGDPFVGTTGNSYLPNFEWSRHVAGKVTNEIADRKAKRKSRKSKKPSGGLPTPTKSPKLVGASAPPLDDLVGVSAPPLRDLVGVPAPPETYVVPTGTYVVGDSPHALGLKPTRGAPPVEWKIIDAEIVSDQGDTWFELAIENDAGIKESDSIMIEANAESEQRAGQETLARFSVAADRNIECGGDLIGLRYAVDGQGKIQPLPINADPMAAAA